MHSPDAVLGSIGIILLVFMMHGSWMLHRKFRSKSTLILFVSQLLLLLSIPLSGLLSNALIALYQHKYEDSMIFGFVLLFLDKLLPMLLVTLVSLSYWVFAKNCKQLVIKN